MLRMGFGAAVIALGIAAAESGAAVSLNLPEAFSDTKQILASGGTADILVLGDSLSYRSGSYLPFFRDAMQARFGNAGRGYQAFSPWTGAGYNNGNIWTLGIINEDTAPHQSLDGLWSRTDVGPVAISGQQNRAYFDAWSGSTELQYVKGPGAGSFRVDLPDGHTAMIDAKSERDGIGTWRYQFPAGQNRLWFEPQGDGMVTILGANNTTASPGVRVHRAANGGWGVNNFLQRDWTFDEQFKLLDPDLVMVWLGVNDAMHYGQSEYETKMNLLVDRIQADAPAAEIVLIGTYDVASDGRIEGIVKAMAAVAAERNVGFISMYDVGGSYQSLVDRHFLDDIVHLSPAGGAFFGDALYNAFESDGASLVPEPSTCALAAMAALALLMRRRGRWPQRNIHR